MSQALKRALARGMLLLACTGCAPLSDNAGAPFKAAIVTSVGGQYQLTTVSFATLTDMRHMQGTIGAIVGAGSLDLTAEANDVIKSQDPAHLVKNAGSAVAVNFCVRAGISYPMDFGSMEILGLYYAYEKTVTFWQDTYQLPPVDPKPRLYYDPDVTYNDGKSSIEGLLKTNAAYMPATNDFIFFKTSRVEKFPVKINLAIIGHEYFHYIFHRKFAAMDASIYEAENLASSDQLDGINEGLADFFAFLVTGNTTEYGESIASMRDQRSMPVPWTLSTLPDAPCAGSYYCKGSILASALHEIATSFAYRPTDVGAVVLAALEPFRNDWLKTRDTEDFDYDVFLNRLLQPLGQKDRSQYCGVFRKWFDDDKIRTKLTCD